MITTKSDQGVLEVASLRQQNLQTHAQSASADYLYRPPQNEVARLAFEIYEARPRHPGRDWEDWFEAESILMLEAHVAQISQVIQTVEEK